MDAEGVVGVPKARSRASPSLLVNGLQSAGVVAISTDSVPVASGHVLVDRVHADGEGIGVGALGKATDPFGVVDPLTLRTSVAFHLLAHSELAASHALVCGEIPEATTLVEVFGGAFAGEFTVEFVALRPAPMFVPHTV